MNHHWHIYSRDQLNSGYAGDGVLILAVPAGNTPRIKGFAGRILDPGQAVALVDRGEEASVLRNPFGLIFEGIDRGEAADFVQRLVQNALEDPVTGFEIHWQNKETVCRARSLFVLEPSLPVTIDPLTFCLTRGLTHLLPSLARFASKPAGSPADPWRRPGILIVEDDEQQVGMFQLLMESAGYDHILTAPNGAEALPLLKAHGEEIDLILLNWLMPRMDGITLLRVLAQGYPHPVGVVMESGYSDERHKREFFSTGTHSVVPIDYVAKPFPFEEFKLEIKIAMQFMQELKRGLPY